MAKKMHKTNAMRQLDTAGVPYEALSYSCEIEDFDGEKVAELVGLQGARVFKTLVTRDDRKQLVVCCIPVTQRIDLKALAAAAGRKRLEMVRPSELFSLTGYIRGGCSPIGMKKAYPVFIDSSALQWDRISISAGICGTQLLLQPDALIQVCGATTGCFCQA